jgi:hypothetical protein
MLHGNMAYPSHQHRPQTMTIPVRLHAAGVARVTISHSGKPNARPVAMWGEPPC